MIARFRIPWVGGLFTALVLALLLVTAGPAGGRAVGPGRPQPSPGDREALVGAGVVTATLDAAYLPLVWRQGILPLPAVAGLEAPAVRLQDAVTLTQDLRIRWTRTYLSWGRVEPVDTDPAAYDWTGAAAMEEKVLAARKAGLEPIVVLAGIPSWARVDPDVPCSRIRDDQLPEMAEFVQAVVERYRGPPYWVRYWEIGNEPDVAPEETPPYLGCWGDFSLPGFGGEHYARVLQTVYPAIKGADPNAVVLFGSLLLDYPESPRAAYLEGALKEGAGPYFDALGVHYYAEHYGFWSGGFRGKIAFLREALARYGVPDKPIYLTETSRRCWTRQPDGTYVCSDVEQAMKAQHVLQILTWSRAEDLRSVIWFGLQAYTFQHSGLLEPDGTPRPAYRAYRTWTRMIEGLPYLRQLTPAELGVDDPRLEGYAFRAPEGERWVLWILPPNWVGLDTPPELDPPIALPLPAQALRVYDPYGTVLLEPAAGGVLYLKGPWATQVVVEAPFGAYVDVAR